MLLTDYLALLLCLLLSGLILLGVLSERRWAQALAYTAAALVFAAHVLGARQDWVWPWLIPHPSVLMLSFAAVWGPLAAVLIGLAQHQRSSFSRRAVQFIALLVACYGVYSIVRPLQIAPVRSDSYWEDEVLIQSTGSSCVAAASATYLHTLGIEIDEEQAARSGLISREGGDQLSAWRILRLHLGPEYRVRAGPLTRAQVEAMDNWVLSAANYSSTEGHELVIRALPDGNLLLRDPTDGEVVQSWEEFEPHWQHTCVWAEQE